MGLQLYNIHHTGEMIDIDIALAQEVVLSQRGDMQEHVDTDGNVTKKHKNMYHPNTVITPTLNIK